ncbi:hypothetical protein ANN_03428 [Periplaneta americana]|uniref:RING-type E3 ubiquitin transferase n=1 Tax=Periplaneta americana TaxID=6978 RepID=A0ABQ8TYX6_PERAM|nr:hypothetical protein ANN_03428 [Periplaneta americana]
MVGKDIKYTRKGDIAWPPRSPDLTVCDFFLWEHLKTKVFGGNPARTIPALKQRIRGEVAAISLIEMPVRNDFEDELRITSLLPYFQCKICQEYLTIPIVTCERGHNVCTSCRIRQEHCRVCKGNLSDTRNRMLEEMVEDMEYPCRRRELGCFDFLKQCDLGLHEKTCAKKNSLQCPLRTLRRSRCNWSGERPNLKEHFLRKHVGNLKTPTGPDNSILLHIPVMIAMSSGYQTTYLEVHDQLFLCIWENVSNSKNHSTYFSVINLGGPDTVGSHMSFTFSLREKDSLCNSMKHKKLEGNVVEIDEIYQGRASGADPDSKQGRLIFIRHGINAARCSAVKKGDEEKSYGSP